MKLFQLQIRARSKWLTVALFSAVAVCVALPARSIQDLQAQLNTLPTAGPSRGESPAQAEERSTGCLTCHTRLENRNMHPEDTVVLGCTDCHGGDASVRAASVSDTEAKRTSGRGLHTLVAGITRVHTLRQSGGPASRSANLRHRGLPHAGSTQRSHQHDVARSDVVGGGAL